MDTDTVMGTARQQLSDAVTNFQEPPFYPIRTTPWIAMSAMQKAIRRSRKQIALRAAATLLHLTPDRLWRRLGCVAFEDVGVADLETISLATAVLTGKRFRESLGGDWRVASFIICRMVAAHKCRAADDLLLVAESHPAFTQARLEFATYSTGDLIGMATGSHLLPIRAIAAWYAAGTNRRPSQHLKSRRGDPAAVFDGLCDAGIPGKTVEIAREGFRKVGELLAPFVALLCPMRGSGLATTADDKLPAEVVIGDVPGWALDMYTREGRAALQAFIDGSTETARWVRARIPPRQRVAFLGGIVFRLEGGCVRARLRWPTGDELRRMVDVECNGPHCLDATEILGLMSADIPVLNRVRAQVMGV